MQSRGLVASTSRAKKEAPSRNGAMPRTTALVVAAGTGSRAGSGLPKQYRIIAGTTVLRRTLDALLACRAPAGPIDAVRVVIRPEHHPLYVAATQGLDLPPPIHGGETRQDSVRAGLEALAADSPDRVLIHDAARPFVDPALVGRVAAALDRHEGAIAALPVVDTLRRVEDGIAAGTVPRDGLWAAQTPQGFRFAAILAAHRAAAGLALTDDAAVAERAGHRVAMVQGSPDNVKITTEEDLRRAEMLTLRQGSAPALPDLRLGNGFDVHRFASGDGGGTVILCGVPIPHPRRLDGHSDADVGLHALTDALLGAIAAGDIGQHFPPSDPQWKGADSALFLRHAATLVAARGTILNVDVTLLCEAPRIGPHRAAMIDRIASLLGIAADRVSVKATTTERLGFLGRREGIAAQATACVRIER